MLLFISAKHKKTAGHSLPLQRCLLPAKNAPLRVRFLLTVDYDGAARQPPRYAFLIRSEAASSLPVPDTVMRPDSST